MSNVIDLNVASIAGEPRVDSRLIAPDLGIRHSNFVETLERHAAALSELGVFRFETGKPQKGTKGGRPERFVRLNEDQAIFAMTLSRNTPRVVALKLRLVKAFKRFRDGEQTAAEYLPFYHQLHDAVKSMVVIAHANGSTTPERIFHININKLVNKSFDLKPGERKTASPELKAMLTTANLIVQTALTESIREGIGHKAAYQVAKARLGVFTDAVRPALTAKAVAS